MVEFQFFHEEEAQAICQILLSPMQPKDLLIWRCTTNEEFSIRSAYHMEKELQSMRCGASSIQRDGELEWKTIWNFNITNAVKMFQWKGCNNLLPTKAKLLR